LAAPGWTEIFRYLSQLPEPVQDYLRLSAFICG